MDTNFIQQAARRMDLSGVTSIQLRQGQVFQGTITQIYPGSSAQLQLGQMNLTAHLEAQLEKGRSYWFRVQSSEGMPRLQVLENVRPVEQGRNASAEARQVLQQMGLQPTRTAEQALQHFTRENIPVNRETMQQAVQQLQQSPLAQRESLQLMGTMLRQDMPLTQASFQGMASLQMPASSAGAMGELLQQLRAAPAQGQASQQLQQVLSSLLSRSDPAASGPQLQQLAQMAASGNSQQQAQAAAVLQQIGVSSAGSPQAVMEHFRQQVLQPSNSQALQSLFPDQAAAVRAAAEGTGSQQPSTPLQQMTAPQLFQQLMGSLRLDTPQAVQQLVQLMGGGGQEPLRMLDQFVRNAPPQQLRAAWTSLQQLDQSNWTGSSTAGQMGMQQGQSQAQAGDPALRMLMQQLGLQHEASLRGGSGQQPAQTDAQASLKSALMQYLEQPANAAGRGQAEFLLNRVTGSQLMSHEQQQPSQQLLVQIPLTMFEKHTDMTLQWSGKKEEDGSFNADHCRILFYLQLDALKETVVDVQIQKRVVQVTVYNDEPKPRNVDSIWGPLLKESLENMEYRLSSVQWKQRSTGEDPAPQLYGQNMSHKGVDYRA
ncbi:hypothetical protein [Alkalicoccus chagannorensis]|uniref:hypothetical protein n=1 Tax=Alkalicoccus chagannorensis TaxID=427072 RepID=UPI0004010D74|nr:hypothetical protein [Alkalicoccus chagannorensis]